MIRGFSSSLEFLILKMEEAYHSETSVYLVTIYKMYSIITALKIWHIEG
jgi:hypothetical protein